MSWLRYLWFYPLPIDRLSLNVVEKLQISKEKRVIFLKLSTGCSAEFETKPWQNQQNDCVPSKDSDQPGHPPSLIRVFAVRMKKAWVLKPRLHDRTSIQLIIWNVLFHIPCRATQYNLIYISLKIPVFHWVMQTCWHSLIWVKVKQESVTFSADSGVVWAVQCFALLKFIIPFVFLISLTHRVMIQQSWNNVERVNLPSDQTNK